MEAEIILAFTTDVSNCQQSLVIGTHASKGLGFGANPNVNLAVVPPKLLVLNRTDFWEQVTYTGPSLPEPNRMGQPQVSC